MCGSNSAVQDKGVDKGMSCPLRPCYTASALGSDRRAQAGGCSWELTDRETSVSSKLLTSYRREPRPGQEHGVW